MATLNQIVYDILEVVRNNSISDDTELDERQIIYHINIQRSLWIRNEYNKPGRKLDPSLIQTLDCLKLIDIDESECCEVSTDCLIKRTELQIPNFIDLHKGPALTKVGPITKTTIPWNFVDEEVATLSSYNKYAKGVFTYLLNGYLYVVITDPNLNDIKYISLKGVFEDPTKLIDYKCSNGNTCFSRDNEYPISSWMIAYLKEQVQNQLLSSLKIPRDLSNDANENLNK